MSKEIKNKILPKLRFPKFKEAGEWQLTTIGEVGKFHYGKSAPKWSLSSDAPTLCVRYGELYTKFDTIISEIFSRTNIDPSNLRFSKGGEILIPRVGEVPQDFGKNCCYLPFPNIAIGEMISVYETEEYPIFYAYYFRTMWKQFAEVVEGQNVKNLYYVNLEPIIVGKPSYIEQQKIASCLSSLDELITSQSQKLEALKTHKKGLMQQLFPAEGETVPKRRFEEFRESEEWEIKSLGNIAENLDFKRIPITGNIREKGDVPYYGASGIIDYVKDFIFDETLLCISEDGANLVDRNYPIAFSISGRTWVNNHTHVLRFEKVFTQVMVENYLNSINLEDFLTGMAQPKLNRSKLDIIPIPLPKSEVEQQKIADCLSSLDELITAQTQKIEELKKHKKGLMQGLFPNINELPNE